MKIIDLLNKINNGEGVPEKIKFNGIVFEYDKRQQEYNYKNDGGYYETLLYRVMTTHFIRSLLRTEVEVIEENKEIDIQAIKEIDVKDQFYRTDNIDKLNELTRAIKQIDKELNELKSLDYLEISERDINDAIKKAREYMDKEREEK